MCVLVWFAFGLERFGNGTLCKLNNSVFTPNANQAVCTKEITYRVNSRTRIDVNSCGVMRLTRIGWCHWRMFAFHARMCEDTPFRTMLSLTQIQQNNPASNKEREIRCFAFGVNSIRVSSSFMYKKKLTPFFLTIHSFFFFVIFCYNCLYCNNIYIW